MSKNYLDDEKLRYENIEIPEELDFMVRKTLNFAHSISYIWKNVY